MENLQQYISDVASFLGEHGMDVPEIVLRFWRGEISYRKCEIYIEIIRIIADLDTDAVCQEIALRLKKGVKYVQNILREMSTRWHLLSSRPDPDTGNSRCLVWSVIKDVKNDDAADGINDSADDKRLGINDERLGINSMDNGELRMDDEESVVSRLGATAQLIVRAMLADEHVTIVELSEMTRVTTQAVEKHIRNLRRLGVVWREGSRKRGRWRVIKN